MDTQDKVVVQPDAVSEETESKVAAEAESQPSPAELLKQIQEARAEMAKMAEDAKRSIQSAKDKARAEVEAARRNSQVVEKTLKSAQAELEETDPVLARDLELARYRTGEEARREEEAARTEEAQRTAFHTQFIDSLASAMKEMGVDPADKRIDWADDAENYTIAQKRILSSAAKIQKASMGSLTAQVKELQAQIKKLSGEADSVDTSAGSGAGSDSDKAFLKKFASGDIPLNKANLARYNKLVEA